MINHQDWQEQIPFYIAQSLSPEQRRSFETHLATCAACQTELDEWRMIASAVWREADEVARKLPPLSQEVYNRLSYQDKPPVSRYAANPPRPASAAQALATPSAGNLKVLPKPRRVQLPITMVAGLLVAVLFGGLLLIYALRKGESGEVALALTASADSTEEFGGASNLQPSSTSNTSGIIPTEEASATVELSTTNLFITNTPEVIVINPTLEPSPEPFVPTREFTINIAPPQPTNTPEPTLTNTVEPVAPLGAGPYITITPGVYLDGAPYCEIYNPTNVMIEIYIEPNLNAEIVTVLMPSQILRVLSMSDQGWYYVASPSTAAGWVAPSMAYLRGSCYAGYDIPFATPFATLEPSPTYDAESPYEPAAGGQIVVINAAYADLLAEASFSSATIGAVNRNEQFPILGYQGTGTNRFVQVQLADGRTAWIWAQIVIEYPANQAPPSPTAQP